MEERGGGGGGDGMREATGEEEEEEVRGEPRGDGMRWCENMEGMKEENNHIVKSSVFI